MIERYFTKDLDWFSGNFDIYKEFKWKKVDVEIKDFKTGEIIFEGHDLEFPEHYSQQACDIIASKYFFRNIDGNGTQETSLRQVVHRMVRFWVEALLDENVIEGDWMVGDDEDDYAFGYPFSVECFNYFTDEAEILYDELVYTLLNQMWAPNSPQWFNTGIGYYGVKGESDDMYYFDIDGIHKSPDRYTRSQTSACFIIPVADHLIGKNSITDHYVTETKLFKGGSGVGTNFSPLRAEGESLSSGGKSSGVMSFLLGLDRNAGAIKSGGTTRRAAKMVILDVDHPDIEEFIDWKVHEEKKAQDLISLGYDGGMNGEAYLTVSGQNSNNSVRVSDEFMEKVLWNDPDSSWELKGRVDEKKNRIVDAHELWDKICTAAWECADPGIQFDDRYNEWHTAPNSGRINATNPCSEYAFLDNSACNLASINVLKFYDKISYDIKSFNKLVHLCQLVLEASIHWGQFPTEEVAENSYKFRATGLGLANLGALLLKYGFPYDSHDGTTMGAMIAANMTAQSYLTSAMIAREIGCCEGYDDNSEEFFNVLTKHREYAESYMLYGAMDIFDQAMDLVNCHGVRNMQVTVMAPTGTISFAMDCDSTGIEPFFSHRVYKKCSDGSMMEMTNPLAEEYIENEYNTILKLDDIKNYFDEHGTYQGCQELTNDEQKVLETANEISPEAHVRMMEAIQPFISGSISKTVNLPNTATVEDIKHIYEMAYKVGLKSISIYRDGSKGTQPLTTKKDEDKNYKWDAQSSEFVPLSEIENTELYKEIMGDPKDKVYPFFTYTDKHDLHIKVDEDNEVRLVGDTDGTSISSEKPVLFIEPEVKEIHKEFKRNKPEGVRNSRTHTAKIGNVELYITVSYYDNGDLCEIFVSSDKEGTTTKGLLSSLSKAISHMLQYGIDPISIANMLKNQQYEPAGSTERHPYIKMASSISDMIARVIELECGDFTRCHVKPPENINANHTQQVFVLSGYGDESASEFYNKVKETQLEIDDDFDLVDDEPPIEYMEYENEDGETRYAFKRKESEDHCPICGADYEYENEIGYCPNCQHTIKLPEDEYTGNECPVCGSKRMVPNGTCEICLDCFNTSGCS